MGISKIKKIILIIVCISMVITSTSLATSGWDVNMGPNSNLGGNDQKIINAGNQIIGIIQIVGTAIAVVMLIVLAMRYMMAAPDGKADIKKTATIYIIGAVILFGAVGILQVIRSFALEASTGTHTHQFQEIGRIDYGNGAVKVRMRCSICGTEVEALE